MTKMIKNYRFDQNFVNFFPTISVVYVWLNFDTRGRTKSPEQPKDPINANLTKHVYYSV